MLNPDAITMLRSELCRMLEKAVQVDPMPPETVDDIIEQALDNRTQIWIVWDERILCVATTVIMKHPDYKSIRCNYLAGEGMGKWLKGLVENILEFGKEQGCKDARVIYYREGWSRVLRSLGFERVASVSRLMMEK